MKFISQDENFFVDISRECLDCILKNVKKAGNYETGGILTGNYSDDLKTAFIKLLTGPPVDSKKGSTWFNRGTQGLKKLIDKLWSKNTYYLGEWHFHPNASPIPSGQDKRQMKEIAVSKQYNCPEPIMLIIGGNHLDYKFAVFVFTRRSEIYELKEINPL